MFETGKTHILVCFGSQSFSDKMIRLEPYRIILRRPGEGPGRYYAILESFDVYLLLKN